MFSILGSLCYTAPAVFMVATHGFLQCSARSFVLGPRAQRFIRLHDVHLTEHSQAVQHTPVHIAVLPANHRFGRSSASLSSCRRPQAALKFSDRSDTSDPGLTCGIKSAGRKERDADLALDGPTQVGQRGLQHTQRLTRWKKIARC